MPQNDVRKALEVVREALLAHHREQLHDLEQITLRLTAAPPSYPVLDLRQPLNGAPSTAPVAPPDTLSQRDLVRQAVLTEWRSAEEIAAVSGLSARQVRGVLGAKGFGERFQRRRNSSGTKLFLYSEGGNPK